MVPNERDVQQGVLRERLLYAQEVALHVAVFRVRRNVGDVVGARRERRSQPYGIALVQRPIPRGGRCAWLRYRNKQSAWCVDGQNVARTGAGVVDKACAVAAANGNPWRQGIGEADTRSVVIKCGIDERLPIDATAAVG